MSKTIEPLPMQAYPKSLRYLPPVVAHELYRYRVVGRGPARVFYQEYEESLRAKHGGGRVAFSVSDIVLYFANAAAAGVIGNIAYNALMRAVTRLRKPKQELVGGSRKFELVISRRTYERLRKDKHQQGKPSRTVPPITSKKLETQYRLMVLLTKKKD